MLNRLQRINCITKFKPILSSLLHIKQYKTMSSASNNSPFITIDQFCLRQFLSNGYPYIPISPDELTDKVNEYYSKNSSNCLIEGYAPFCKHIFIPNFISNLPACYVPITDSNKHLLLTKYEARTEKELPVLIRYFNKKDVTIPDATYLDMILYSREQIIKENNAMKDKKALNSNENKNNELNNLKLSSHNNSTSEDSNWQWCIVSIKPQLVNYETPMNPITMMRNALGVEEGGSGIKLDREKYMKSVEFWSNNASVV